MRRRSVLLPILVLFSAVGCSSPEVGEEALVNERSAVPEQLARAGASSTTTVRATSTSARPNPTTAAPTTATTAGAPTTTPPTAAPTTIVVVTTSTAAPTDEAEDNTSASPGDTWEPEAPSTTWAATPTTTWTPPPTTTPPPPPPTTVPPPPPTTTPPPPPANYDAGAEGEFFANVNSVRAGQGLAPLAYDGSLTSYARWWAGEMAASDSLSHSNISSLLGSWWTVGENVGVGPTVQSIHNALVASSGHYANIVGGYTHLGVGVAIDSQGRIWVAQVYGG